MKRKITALTSLAFLLIGTLAIATACKKKPPTTVPEERSTEAPERPAETRVPPPATTPPPSDVSASPLEEEIAVLNQKGYLSSAYFDYDQADLRDDARTALAANAEWLKKYPTIQVLIEGHCDERGTSEYNLALGDKRANAAKDYIESLGVDSSRVRTVSYGKERPQCSASTEECWQQNRRANFVITAK